MAGVTRRLAPGAETRGIVRGFAIHSQCACTIRCCHEETLLTGPILFALVLAVALVVGLRIYSRRADAQRAAHDARLSAMAQTYLAAARKKKAAEAAAAKTPVTTEASSSGAPLRDERECPFCAEPILKKAKVCKHCQREVDPLA